MANNKTIPAKYLSGLKFRHHEQVDTEDGSKKFRRVEEPLTADRVLDWSDNGDTVTIVAADGQKHTVAKKGGE